MAFTIFFNAGIQCSIVLCSGIIWSAVVLSLWCSVGMWCSVWMHGVFILWNLLEDIAQLQPWPCSLAYCSGVKAICIRAESVFQNCVMGRCANLHIHILLHRFWSKSICLVSIWMACSSASTSLPVEHPFEPHFSVNKTKCVNSPFCSKVMSKCA